MASSVGGDGPSFEEIAETFALLDDWEAKYEYVIELGAGLPGLEDSQKTPATKVDGCASQVWLATEIEADENGLKRLTFEGDSDAHIVRGLIAILKALLSGRAPADIAASDPIASLREIGLESQLSSQRSNGLRAMVERLMKVAHSCG